MLRRIYTFWMFDEKERTRAIAVAIAATFTYGMLFNVLLGRDLPEVSREALVPLVAILLFWPIVKDGARRIRNWSVTRRVIGSLILATLLVVVPAAISAYLKNRIKSIAELPPQAFQNSLNKAAQTLAAISASGIKVPQSTLLQQKLSGVDPGVSGYWPTVSQLITYRSKDDLPRSFAPQLPRCYDQRLRMIGHPGESFSIWNRPLEWEECVLDLDEEMPDVVWDYLEGWEFEKAHVIGANPYEVIRLTQCLVRYQGGPISERVFRVLGYTTFRDCLFQFSFASAPPREGERISRVLLRANSLQSVSLTSLRGF